MIQRLLKTLFPALLAIACAGKAPVVEEPEEPSPATVFPTAAEMESLAASTPKELRSSGLDVPTWELTGPFPDAIKLVAAPIPEPWTAMFQNGAGKMAVASTQDMNCVARELARFYATHGTGPSETLRRHIAGWCGSVAVDWDVQVLAGDIATEVSDATIAAQWSRQVAELAGTLRQGRATGVGFQRQDGKAVLLVASAQPAIKLDSVAITPGPDGTVRLRGEVIEPAESLRVLVNRGHLGFGECTLYEAVQLPSFEARCAVAPDDTTAWIEISATPPGRVLGHSIFRMLVRRPDAKATFTVPELELAGEKVAATADLGQLVNAARETAGMQALTMVVEESTMATRLAPHYFAAQLGGDVAGTTDRVALGLMAGWHTGGPVTGASFYSSWTRAGDARQLVVCLLDSPMGRSALFDPAATHLAVGGLNDAKIGASGGLFVTYRMLSGDAVTGTEKMFEAARAAREERGLPVPSPMSAMDDQVKRVADSLGSGEMTPEDALDRLIARSGTRAGGEPKGFLVTAESLAEIKLPEGLFVPGDVYTVVMAAPYRAAGNPWWRWAVVFVVGPR